MTRFRLLANLIALWLFCHQIQATTSNLIKKSENPKEEQLFSPTTYNNEPDFKPRIESSETSDYITDDNMLEEYEDLPRGMRVGLLNYGNRNMTMNLSSLVVLGLGMAAAVSLFSHFDSPQTFFRKRSAEIEDDRRTFMDIFQYATLLNENLQKEEFDETDARHLNVSEVLEESLETLCKLGILCYQDGKLDIGQTSVDNLDKINTTRTN